MSQKQTAPETLQARNLPGRGTASLGVMTPAGGTKGAAEEDSGQETGTREAAFSGTARRKFPMLTNESMQLTAVLLKLFHRHGPWDAVAADHYATEIVFPADDHKKRIPQASITCVALKCRECGYLKSVELKGLYTLAQLQAKPA